MNLNDDQLMDFNSGMTALADKHYTLALKLLSPLAELGVAEAQHRLAVMYQNGLGVAVNLQQAANWMKKSADNGYDLALHGMGFMYLEGEGVEKNINEAINWLEKGVEKGLIGSMTVLADMYKQGIGVDKNEAEAERLLKLAGF
ncbi:MAG: sel1 repeat family protein [Gammaproteobacteria bacterium]|nr:sel1 repeat family protein [Gammaproteobacteria bacterium]